MNVVLYQEKEKLSHGLGVGSLVIVIHLFYVCHAAVPATG